MKTTGQKESGQRILALVVEVSGCKHACSFCGAAGHYYLPMEVGDVERILAQTAEFCRSEHLEFQPYPMHEVLGHPHALRILELFNHHCSALFEPLPTSGLALSTRRDRGDLLTGIKSLGVKTLWFTFHGIGEVHNRIVHHENAFATTTRSVKLGREAGFRCGANILVTKASAPQIPEIIKFVQEIGLNEMAFEISHYTPSPRMRKYEAIRPELVDLMPYSETIRKHSGFWKDKWGDLPKYAEAHYVEAALNPQKDVDVRWSYFDENRIALVCRSNMDLHTGTSGQYGPRHGNLANGDVRQTLLCALEAGPYPDAKLYFPNQEIPAIADLARDFGNPTGQRVYFLADSMRRRWLDLASGLGEGKKADSQPPPGN